MLTKISNAEMKKNLTNIIIIMARPTENIMCHVNINKYSTCKSGLTKPGEACRIINCQVCNIIYMLKSVHKFKLRNYRIDQ
jgi:hypothetical protein